MLNRFFSDQLRLGLAQALAAAVVAFAVVLLARRRRIHLERETTVALVRGLVQIVAVGSLLSFCFGRRAGPAYFCLPR